MADNELIELPIDPLPDLSRFALIRLAGRSVPPMLPVVRDLVFACMNEWSTI